jgi:exopolyphosphatase/guanosine-5'-triphosphate,3'-diphosphate pyrophosphatase
MISTFVSDLGMTSDMAVTLMRSVPERLNTIIPGLIIASVLSRRFQSHWITYSDSGVREGYIYDRIIGK